MNPTVTITVLEFALWQAAFLGLGILTGALAVYISFVPRKYREE